MALKINKIEKTLTYKYIPISQRAEENPFTVEIKRLTPKEFMQIEDKMLKFNRDESISFTSGSFNWEVCKHGIENWSGLLDENGKEIKPVKDINGFISDESLNLLPLSIIAEIANVIAGITKDPENIDFYLGKDEKD